jgi:hypothetical protein
VALMFISLLFGTVFHRIAENANDIAGLQSLIAAIFMTAA